MFNEKQLQLYLVFTSAAAYTLWSALISYNPVGELSIFGFINPVSGTILNALVLGDDIFKLEYLISLFPASAGIIIVNIRKRK